MEKQELRDKLNLTKKKLVSQCKDTHFANLLIDELLSIKGELGIEPASVFVSGNVVSEIKNSAYSIYKTDDGNIVFAMNGYRVIINSNLDVYYFPFDSLLNTHDGFNSLSDKEKEYYGILLSHVCLAMQMPTILFSDPELFSAVMITYESYLNKILNQALNPDNLPASDANKDVKIKEVLSLADFLGKELNKEKNGKKEI